MPVGTAVHERTFALCESLSYREWAGYYAVSVYETHHEHEYNAIRNAAALIDVTPLYKYMVTGRDATKLGPAHPVEPFSLAFLDPPYGQGLAAPALISARDGGWLSPSALVIVEEAAKSAFAVPTGFSELERRGYDDTEFVFCRLNQS